MEQVLEVSSTPVENNTLNTHNSDLLAGVRNGTWLSKQDFPELTYAIQGVVPEGFTIIVGAPKIGKSWLVLNFLLAVASGGMALSAITTGKPRTVLYLALEDGDRRMQSRCIKLLGDANIPADFHYLTHVRPGVLLATIDEYLSGYPDTALIVVDTLGKIIPDTGGGESAYQRDYRISSALKARADDHPGLAIIGCHHDRKANADDFVDAVSGTHGLAGAADTIVVVARKRLSQEGILKVTGRDVTENEYAVTITDGVNWILDGGSLEASAEIAREREDEGNLGDRSLDILKFINSHPEGLSLAEITSHFPDVAGVGMYVSRLYKDKRIDKLGRGRYIPFPKVLPDGS